MRVRSALIVMSILISASCAKSPSQSVSSSPSSTATVSTSKNATHGTILVDSKGMTLYRFDPEANGKIACVGDCATTWPPLLHPSGEPSAGVDVTGKLGVITRPDGGRQVTHDGAPLYRYSSDGQPGVTSGDGVGGVWHLVVVAAANQPAPGGVPQGSPSPAPETRTSPAPQSSPVPQQTKPADESPPATSPPPSSPTPPGGPTPPGPPCTPPYCY